MAVEHALRGGGFLLILLLTVASTPSLCGQGTGVETEARSPLIDRMRLLHWTGTRPRWSPDGRILVFDQQQSDSRFYSLLLSDLDGKVIARLTDGTVPGIQHHGNGIFSPDGQRIAFISQVNEHLFAEYSHLGQVPIGDPGVGLFSNLWLTDGLNYWQLTDVPIKTTLEDDIPAIGIVNPEFSPDGSRLIWTERYAPGGNLNWGLWRLKTADLIETDQGPQLHRERVLFTPENGTFVTAMEYLTPSLILVAGNLDGQHEFGMDLYLLHPATGGTKNLTSSPEYWEEGSCITPSGRIVYMTNRDSGFPIDVSEDWVGQPTERDYWIMDWDGSNKQRLTYFNDVTAPEYQGWRSVTIACDVSPDGRTIAATVGRDFGDEDQAWLHWQVWLIELNEPL